jgi:two-component system response regulator (stage 0 sporulation protein A)
MVQAVVREKEDTMQRVTELLHQMGIPAHVKGYLYLRSAILLSVEEPELLDSLKHGLYNKVAQRYATTPRKVEQCIGTALDFTAVDMENAEVVCEYFGDGAVKNQFFHVSNAVFIRTVVVRILEEREIREARGGRGGVGAARRRREEFSWRRG